MFHGRVPRTHSPRTPQLLPAGLTSGSPPRPPLGPILGLPTLSPATRVPLSPEAARTPGCFPGHVRRLQEDTMGKALRGGLETGRNEGPWKEVKSPLT